MKRLVVLFFAILALLSLLLGCSPASDPTVPDESFSRPHATPPQLSSVPTASMDIDAVDAKMEAMLPVLDSVAQAIGTCGTNSYEPSDSNFFWSVLCFMGTSWADTHSLITQENGLIVAPSQAMQDFAFAAFSDKNLLPIPDGFEERLTYDPDRDVYLLTPAEPTELSTQFDGVSIWENGSVFADVSLYAKPDMLLGMVEFVLSANPDAQSPYPYTVAGAGLTSSFG